MSKTHSLKLWPSQFNGVESGAKTFEVRNNTDRDFEVGDILLLRKWDPARTYSGPALAPGCYIDPGGNTTRQATDAATLRMRVTYILHGGQFGVPDGVCVMSIKPAPEGYS